MEVLWSDFSGMIQLSFFGTNPDVRCPFEKWKIVFSGKLQTKLPTNFKKYTTIFNLTHDWLATVTSHNTLKDLKRNSNQASL